MPSPQLEKPMPVRYCPIAIPALPSSVFSTAPRNDCAISSIAFKLNMSVMTLAALVVYPSMAWVSASMPVEAVSPFGMLDIMSGSTKATTGMSCASTQTNFLFFSTSVMT